MCGMATRAMCRVEVLRPLSSLMERGALALASLDESRGGKRAVDSTPHTNRQTRHRALPAGCRLVASN